MAEPFLGEIKMCSFNFAPKGWALANGQLLPINQNQALFSLFGTIYGGNGQTTFALPNLRGCVPIHFGQGFTQGEKAGSTAVTITQQTMAQHIHFAQGSTNSTNNVASPGTGVILGTSGNNIFGEPAGSLVACRPEQISSVGGSQPHTNMMPYLVINFVVALVGIFPSQN
jgi:microcystin-dependent protein